MGKKFRELTSIERLHWNEDFAAAVRKNFKMEQEVDYILDRFSSPWDESAYRNQEVIPADHFLDEKYDAIFSELQEEFEQ